MFFAMFKFYWFTNKECITYGPYFLSIITDRISGGDGMDFTTKKTLKNKVNSFSMKVVNFFLILIFKFISSNYYNPLI